MTAKLKCVDLLHTGVTHSEDEDEKKGIEIVLESLYSPTTQILQNAGLDSKEITNKIPLHWGVKEW